MQGPSTLLSIIVIIAGIAFIGVVVYQILPLLWPKAKTNSPITLAKGKNELSYHRPK
jgi:hypothetical protein